MTVDAFERHDAFERTGDGFTLTTIPFENRATVQVDESQPTYTVLVRAPTLDSTTAGEVGPTVSQDWFETLSRRLVDAPKATRVDVALDHCNVERDGETVEIKYRFTWTNPEQAVEIAKTLAEYVEGTYVEGIIPGYEYEPPVADLLDAASTSGNGGAPL